MRYSRTAAPASLIGAILALSVVLAILATAGLPSRVGAQAWPTNWISIDTDPDEPGQANYRDVVAAYYNYDTSHLYLRLQTVATPSFSGANGQARFKWFIDVGFGSNIHRSGGNILGTDYLLFVEDSDNNGTGDVYLLPANGNDTFSQYEPWNNTNVSAITAPDASYRITANYIDVWISFGRLPPATSPTHMSLAWATDQEDPGLESAPNLDSVDTAQTPIHLDADLAVTKDVNNHTPSVGSSVTYTVMVTNSGPAAATNIVITDLLPSGVTYQSYTATQGTYNSGNGQWSVGNLADGASATLTITALVAGTGTITNTAAITAVVQPDPDPADNSDSADIYVQSSPPDEADLIVVKDVDDHFPYVGDPVTFTIEVTNTGPSAASNVEVTDLLPSGVTYQSHSVSQGSYTSGTGLWSIGTLADGATATLTVVALVNAPGTINNTADITDLDQTDPDLEDNSDTAELLATQAPVYPPGPARGVPAFPGMFIGIGAALGAGALAYFVRRRILGNE